jgi:hypothetical protein
MRPEVKQALVEGKSVWIRSKGSSMDWKEVNSSTLLSIKEMVESECSLSNPIKKVERVETRWVSKACINYLENGVDMHNTKFLVNPQEEYEQQVKILFMGKR